MAGVSGGSGQAFDVLLRFVVDKKTVDDVRTGAKDLTQVLQQTGDAGNLLTLSAFRLQPALDAQIKKTQELQNAWWKTQRVLRASTFIFQQLSVAGLAILTPFIALATTYATEAQKVADETGTALDPVAQKWIDLQGSIKVSMAGIGRTSAGVIIPYLEQIDKIASKAAGVIERNPQIIEAALKIGAAVTTVGVLGALITQGIKLIVDIKFVYASAQNLLAADGMVKAAGDNLKAALIMLEAGNFGGAQTAVLGEVGAGSLVGNPITSGSASMITKASTAAAAAIKKGGTVVAANFLNASAGVANVLATGAAKIGNSTTGLSGVLAKGAGAIWTAGLGAAGKIAGAGTKLSASITAVGAASILKFAGVTVIALAIGAEIGKAIGNWIMRLRVGEDYKPQGFNDAFLTFNRLVLLPIVGIAKLLETHGPIMARFANSLNIVVLGYDAWLSKLLKLDDASRAAAAGIENLSQVLSDNKNASEIVSAYVKMVEDDAKAAKEYVVDQEKVRAESNNKLTELAKELANDLISINKKMVDAINKLNADSVLEELRKLQDYNLDRAKTIRDTNEEILQTEKKRKDDLLKLEQEHDMRIYGLKGNRDALGIVEENARYNAEKNAINSSAREETVRRRRELIIKLQDMAAAFTLERSRRAEDLALKIAEETKQAAEDMARRNAEYIQKVNEEKAQAAQRLRDLQTEYLTERQRRRENFIALVRDLDANLLGERQLKLNYYAKMLEDADAFLRAYRSKLPEGSTLVAPDKAAGGYTLGLVNTGEEGREFILSHRTTKLAENVVSGRLNQDNLASRLRSGTGQQIINLNMMNGTTVAQVKRMLNDMRATTLGDISVALGV
jgi:hypothetical protein